MDIKEKKEIFLKKLSEITEEVAAKQGQDEKSPSSEQIMSAYNDALNLILSDEKNLPIIDKLFSQALEKGMQQAFSLMTEEELFTLGKFGEYYFNAGKSKEASKIFQFLTLFCPSTQPHPYPYVMLGESLADINIQAGIEIYDFILYIFPDNPLVLLSAANCYYQGKLPRRALRILQHAQEVCNKHRDETPEFQEFLDQINPKIKALTEELGEEN